MNLIAAHHSMLLSRSHIVGDFSVQMQLSGSVAWLSEAPIPDGALVTADVYAELNEANIAFLKTDVFADLSDLASVGAQLEITGSLEDEIV